MKAFGSLEEKPYQIAARHSADRQAGTSAGKGADQTLRSCDAGQRRKGEARPRLQTRGMLRQGRGGKAPQKDGGWHRLPCPAALYGGIYFESVCKMPALVILLITLAASGTACAAGWVALYYWQPAIPGLIYDLLTLHPWAVGTWLALAAIGCDYALASARNTLGYRDVGAKARTHWRLTGGGQ